MSGYGIINTTFLSQGEKSGVFKGTSEFLSNPETIKKRQKIYHFVDLFAANKTKLAANWYFLSKQSYMVSKFKF